MKRITSIVLSLLLAVSIFSSPAISAEEVIQEPSYNSSDLIPKLSESKITLKPGETYTIKVLDSTGKEIDNTQLNFFSNRARVASVDRNGVVTALSDGVASITVRYNNYSLMLSVNVSGITWEFDESNGTLSINGSGRMQDYIPDNDEVTVPWKDIKDKIKKVVVEGVTSVGAYAFRNCTNLSEVIIGESVQYIGEGAFYNCEKLSKITIKGNAPSCEFSFSNFKNPFELKIKSLIIIYDPSAKKLTLDGEGAIDSTTYDFILGTTDFENIKTIVIGKGITKLHNYLFCAFNHLRNIEIDPDNKFFSVLDGNIYNKEYTKIIKYIPGSDKEYFEIPNTVKVIGDYAFYNISELKKIKIPESVQMISETAFDSEDLIIVGYNNTYAELFAIYKGYTFESLGNYEKPEDSSEVSPKETQNNNAAQSTAKSNIKKDNSIKVSVKAMNVKAKKLKKKTQTAKPITIRNAIGKVEIKITSANKEIKKHLKINTKGKLTIKKWKKAKKGTYKIKVRITAKGNTSYNAKTITKTVKIRIK